MPRIKYQDKNLNQGTDQGRHLVDKSIRKFGMRDVLIVDKNGEIVSGNHRKKAADENNITKERIIKASNDEIIAIQYDDIDLDTKEGKELALALNQTAKLNINIDVEQAIEEVGEDALEWGLEIEENEPLESSTSSSKLEYLQWGNKKVLITDEEIELLNQILDQYTEKFTITAGFTNFIVDATKDRFKSH